MILIGCGPHTISSPPPSTPPSNGGGINTDPRITACIAAGVDIQGCINKIPVAPVTNSSNFKPKTTHGKYGLFARIESDADYATFKSTFNALSNSDIAANMAANTYITDDVEAFISSLSPSQATDFWTNVLPNSKFLAIMNALPVGSSTDFSRQYYWEMFGVMYYNNWIPVGWIPSN